jgi:hypothetical protein
VSDSPGVNPEITSEAAADRLFVADEVTGTTGAEVD